MHQAYGDDLRLDYARAVGMLLKAVNTTTDAARRYALLSVAEGVAIDAGDTDLALDVVGQRTSLFDEDGMRARHGMFLKLRKAVKKPDATLFAFAVTTAEEAAAARDKRKSSRLEHSASNTSWSKTMPALIGAA